MEKETLKNSFSSEYIELLGEKWLDCTACNNALTFNLAIIIYNTIKNYPEKQKVQELSSICNVSEREVRVVISGLSAENTCDINEAIHQLCMLICNK